VGTLNGDSLLNGRIAMKLIHIHGFTEIEPESLITRQYRKFAQKLNWDLDIQEFKWNTLEGNPTKLID
jgi:hypothetical protein